MEFVFLLAVVAVVLGGGVCGVVAIFGLREVKRRLNRLERELLPALPRQSEIRAASSSERFPTAQGQIERPVEPEPGPFAPPSVVRAEPQEQSIEPEVFQEEQRIEPTKTVRDQWSSLEITIGAKWLNWVGMVLVIIGVMFFLKYAYDNQWIGPRGRIAVGALAGIAALVIGEQSRRRGYPILFHALTGGGLATFYGCIYFSFQVYQLTGQTVAFCSAILVTVLAVTIAVIHNAPVICVLGQLGGFLSPVLISSDQSRPIELFSFVAILNLATMGSAYYKNWKNVNSVAFAGTWLLYAGWTGKFYDQSQLGVALFFSALFYLMFLVVPPLAAASHRDSLPAENLRLVALGVVVEFINNSILLSRHYRPWLGMAVILQALTLLSVYAYWLYRCRHDERTHGTLLFGALALVTVAIPIQLSFYAIPIGWALEALLLGFIGQQYRNWVFQLAPLAAIVLAFLGLVARLPLHNQLFTPVFNRPFGSWATVIAMAFALATLLQRQRDRLEERLKRAPAITYGLATVFLCALIHMEISAFWEVHRGAFRPDFALSFQHTSLIFLWSAIPLIFLALGNRGLIRFSIPAALAGYAVGLLVILNGAGAGAWITWPVPFLNLQWLSRFLFVISLWIGANWMRSVPDRPEKWEGWTALLHSAEGMGHVILASLFYAEVDSWISASNIFSSFTRFGFVSVLWSLQALALVGFGLVTRNQFRRLLGFILFGVTVAKLVVVDMSILQPVYRILSFAATGVLLIVAAYLYQKFAKGLVESIQGPQQSEKSSIR